MPGGAAAHPQADDPRPVGGIDAQLAIHAVDPGAAHLGDVVVVDLVATEGQPDAGLAARADAAGHTDNGITLQRATVEAGILGGVIVAAVDLRLVAALAGELIAAGFVAVIAPVAITFGLGLGQRGALTTEVVTVTATGGIDAVVQRHAFIVTGAARPHRTRSLAVISARSTSSPSSRSAIAALVVLPMRFNTTAPPTAPFPP